MSLWQLSNQITFSYIFTVYPGSSHDSYVFQRSSILPKLENKQLFNRNRYHLIAGDSTVAIKPYMMLSYKKKTLGGLTASQKAFNNRLSQTRNIVENVFGDTRKDVKMWMPQLKIPFTLW